MFKAFDKGDDRMICTQDYFFRFRHDSNIQFSLDAKCDWVEPWIGIWRNVS